MIRYRRPQQDDPIIYRLIEQELVPHSHLSKGSLDAVIRELPTRLTRGVTLVGSPNYEADAVAFVHFMIHGDLLYIDLMAVTPAEQRKRYGKSLLSQAERFATSRGCNRAKVMVDKDNRRAKLFYRKLGYKTKRYVPISLCYELEKPLQTRYCNL